MPIWILELYFILRWVRKEEIHYITIVWQNNYRWFSRYVTAAMLVHTYKRILMNFFCYVHQYGRRGLFHLSPTGLKVTWVKTIYTSPYMIRKDCLIKWKFVLNNFATKTLVTYCIKTLKGLCQEDFTAFYQNSAKITDEYLQSCKNVCLNQKKEDIKWILKKGNEPQQFLIDFSKTRENNLKNVGWTFQVVVAKIY